jgi:hypothetical protein
MPHTSFPPAGLVEDLRAHIEARAVDFVFHLGYMDTMIPECRTEQRFRADYGTPTRSFTLVPDGICVCDCNDAQELVDTDVIPWDNIVAIQFAGCTAWARNKHGELQNLMTG